MNYELLDFGRGRKLERFGSVVLDRPSPASEGVSRHAPDLWKSARAKFELDFRNASQDVPERGRWIASSQEAKTLEPWTIAFPWFQMELKCTPFGHLGIFPEQLENWQRIFQEVQRKKKHEFAMEPFRVLNLFAYTGGSTLAAAAAGAQVVHIDSAKNLMPWARRNAELSGLAEAPIRWIAEDALRFVHREIKRGSKYEAIILDPPSFGRGPKGEQWNQTRDLPVLLESCLELLSETPGFILLTNHSPHYDAEKLTTLLKNILRKKTSQEKNTAAYGTAFEPLKMDIRSQAGAFLPCGDGLWIRFSSPLFPHS